MIQLDTIYNMDCLEGMKMIDNDSIDCVITDLPYGVLNRNNKHAQWDSVINLDKFWESLIYIVKPTTPIILFCQGMFTARLMMSQPDMWRYNLVWDKCRATGFLNSRRMPLRYHEDIAVFYRNQPVYNPQMEDLNGREANHPQGGGASTRILTGVMERLTGLYHTSYRLLTRNFLARLLGYLKSMTRLSSIRHRNRLSSSAGLSGLTRILGITFSMPAWALAQLPLLPSARTVTSSDLSSITVIIQNPSNGYGVNAQCRNYSKLN